MRKWVSGILVAGILWGSPGGAVGQTEPAELTELRVQFEKAKKDALVPLKRNYGLALRKRLQELTREGKLDEALAFKKEMDAMAAELIAGREAATTGVVAAPAGRGEVIDFLGVIDVDKDGKPAEKWMLEEGLLMCVRGSMVPKIILPYEPPEEFDMTMTFEQPRLRNGLAFIIPNGAGSLFSVCAAERGGSLSGLSVGGAYHPDFGKSEQGWFEPDKEYTLTVEVRKDSVTGKVDGKEVFTYEGDRSLLNTSHWLKHEKVTQLAISADDPAAISKLEVTEISGSGKMLR